MSFDWSKILSVFKLSMRHVVALAIVAAFVMWAPARWLAWFGLVEFRSQYRPWISMVFLLGAALAVVSAFSSFRERQKLMRSRIQQRASRIRSLETLGRAEKNVLATFVAHNQRTWRFPPGNSAAAGLQARGILSHTAQMISAIHGRQYTIPQWVWDHLREYPEILDGATYFAEEAQSPEHWICH